jgi:hypothetical protein
MSSKIDRPILRYILVSVYVLLIVLLVPWLPVAAWSAAFVFGDPMPTSFDATFVIGKLIPAFVLLYPLFLVHGLISSWKAMKGNRSTALVIFKALYPVLMIVPVFAIVTYFFVS